MELPALRFRYHVTNAIVVVAVLAVAQYWRSAIDPSFLALVAGLYLLFALVIDFVRPLESKSEA